MSRPKASASGTRAADTDAAPAENLFSAVSLGRASAAIVDQIKGLIRAGKLSPGDRLPSERELCTRFGVSRVTVREALRILETNGLITIKVGARGGALVALPTSDQVGANLAELVSMSPLTAQEVTEARLVFEVGIIPLVVQRATAEDVAALREMTAGHAAALQAGTYTLHMSAEFHVRLAACTHNTAIEMLVRSFEGPLLMSLVTAKAAAPLMGKRGGQEHVALIDAIADRDVARAETIMRTHLRRTARRVAKADTAEA
ncbi:MAG TPA: FCD domain-containing protein [Actinophytocola sp.]|jgi:DNA-binding FadR family transcriptional regulator|nr:FCD domain-containing protein [Actinophytocola sp.]